VVKGGQPLTPTVRELLLFRAAGHQVSPSDESWHLYCLSPAASQTVNRTKPDMPLLVGVTALNATSAFQSTGLPVTNATVVAR
jgi:hypothetical protein